MPFNAFKIGRASLKPGTPLIVGVLNVTPDSFSDGGRYFNDVRKAVDHALRMEQEGADIIDVGGESSRPGSANVAPEEEIRRVVPAIRALRKRSSVPVSIDSMRPQTARAAVEAGADMINDITGFTNPEMTDAAVALKIPVVVMHMRGTPATMQKRPRYSDVVRDVSGFLSRQAEMLEKKGVRRIILDPGLGFGKNLKHNVRLLKRLDEIAGLGRPVMVGASRKSFIGALTGAPVGDRLAGTLAAHICSVLKGAALIRVHDVAEHRRALDVLRELL
ncbi:MAG: dihydropteroate synthase [Nitrospinae bacterium]|nr:dihydropteroate synthase [Nitrospinota bacterium]